MIKMEKKQALIKKSRKHDKDTGSSSVQVAVLNERISEVTKHLKKNAKDEHTRRGLLKMVAQRRRHEKYLGSKKSKSQSSKSKK
ncbi:MAG: 30S ribosomal protein S15 [Patescibacteria group bacterium]|nr:30S ribosomal protein S15 [Patescibacteria group bacterium]